MTVLARALGRADQGRRLLLCRVRRSGALQTLHRGLWTPRLLTSCRCPDGIASLPLFPLLHGTHPRMPCQEVLLHCCRHGSRMMRRGRFWCTPGVVRDPGRHVALAYPGLLREGRVRSATDLLGVETVALLENDARAALGAAPAVDLAYINLGTAERRMGGNVGCGLDPGAQGLPATCAVECVGT